MIFIQSHILSYNSEEKVIEMGPLEDDKEHIRQDPLTLPDKFVWDIIDLGNADQVSCY